MKEVLKQKSAAILDEVITIRRHLHAHPELSFQEYETSAYVKSKLTEWGIRFQEICETGIVAVIRPDGNQDDHCIALRADLDALPIAEANEVVYKSKHEGIMHACGHDVHTSILLGAAKIIQDHKNELAQPVKLIFQPGEEKLPGGASLMIKAGVLENPIVDKIYALHVFPELEVGKVGLRSGMYMASCDEIFLTINGKGGHGAMPQQVIDPIYIAAQLVVSLQHIVSRKCPPQIPCVLSFGRIEGLGATNVIPDQVKLEGTFRTMNEEWRKRAHQLIHHHVEKTCESMGATADLHIEIGYPFLENHPELTEEARTKLSDTLGAGNVVDLPLRLTAEDFSYFSQKVPATFIRLGTRNEAKGIIHPVHNSRFDIDEEALKVGVQTLVSIIF